MPFAPALDIGLTYYKIKFEGVIGLPPVGGPATATLYRDYPFLIQTAHRLTTLKASTCVCCGVTIAPCTAEGDIESVQVQRLLQSFRG